MKTKMPKYTDQQVSDMLYSGNVYFYREQLMIAAKNRQMNLTSVTPFAEIQTFLLDYIGSSSATQITR